MCQSCWKYHWGRCLARTHICFKRGQERHIALNCKKRKSNYANQPSSSNQASEVRTAQQQGKVFATTQQEEENLNEVVTGTIPILDHYDFVLFDSGSTYSFISATFVNQANLELKPLGYVLSVSTPAGVTLLASEAAKGCQMLVSDRLMDVTLIALDMSDFDVILGMKWLTSNYANIDYYGKDVFFNRPSKASFKFKGSMIKGAPKVVS
ncbi:MAG: aspartyl protease family protein, partial [Sweet potato little leaf phytoplasma]|nr:aspartyl protease family protein [Sweet potato little leaf phytoplasma]